MEVLETIYWLVLVIKQMSEFIVIKLLDWHGFSVGISLWQFYLTVFALYILFYFLLHPRKDDD